MAPVDERRAVARYDLHSEVYVYLAAVHSSIVTALAETAEWRGAVAVIAVNGAVVADHVGTAADSVADP